MAIDKFREGISRYLIEEIQMQKMSTAKRLEDAAEALRNGKESAEWIKSAADFATEELTSRVATINDLMTEVKDFTTALEKKFSRADIDLPPAEILQQTQVVPRTEKARRIELMKVNLGNPNVFIIPTGQEENLQAPLTERLDLNIRYRNKLIRSGRERIVDLLATSSDAYDRRTGAAKGVVSGLGPQCLAETLDALYRFGVTVKEDSMIVSSPQPLPSPEANS